MRTAIMVIQYSVTHLTSLLVRWIKGRFKMFFCIFGFPLYGGGSLQSITRSEYSESEFISTIQNQDPLTLIVIVIQYAHCHPIRFVVSVPYHCNYHYNIYLSWVQPLGVVWTLHKRSSVRVYMARVLWVKGSDASLDHGRKPNPMLVDLYRLG